MFDVGQQNPEMTFSVSSLIFMAWHWPENLPTHDGPKLSNQVFTASTKPNCKPAIAGILAKGMHFGLLTSTKETMPKYIFRFHMQKDGYCWPLPRYRVRIDNFLAPSPRQAFIFRSFFRPLVLSSLRHQQKSESKSKQPGSDQVPQNSQTRVPLALPPLHDSQKKSS